MTYFNTLLCGPVFTFFKRGEKSHREKVVEPSEVFLAENDSLRGNLSKANPWLRFLARFVDYSFFFFLLRWIPKETASSLFNHFLPIEFFAWVLVESVLLATCGTTPGKWLLNLSIRQGRLRRLSLSVSFQRSLLVWVRGIGMGIAILNAMCMLFAYQRFNLFHITSWDREGNTFVLSKPVSLWRSYLATCIVFIGLTLYFGWKNSL